MACDEFPQDAFAAVPLYRVSAKYYYYCAKVSTCNTVEDESKSFVMIIFIHQKGSYAFFRD